MRKEMNVSKNILIDTHMHRLKEMVDFKNHHPQILGEFGEGDVELTFTVGMHGNEIMPIRAVQELLPALSKLRFAKKGKVRFVVCNVRAISERKRLMEEDLNDVFPGNETGSYESRLAKEILPLVKDSPYVIDLHTGPVSPPFCVLPTKDLKKLELLERSGVNKIVLYENVPGAVTGPMVDCTPCGVGIETGPHYDESSLDEAKKIIYSYLRSFGFLENDQLMTEVVPDYFEIVSTVSLQRGRELAREHSFKEFEAMPANLFSDSAESSVYPFLIDPQRTYDDIYAYIAQKLSRSEIVKKLTE